MGKLILTDQEKILIKKLYENQMGEGESEIVGYFNPFKKTEYLQYLRRYSSNLKNGDLFFVQSEIGDCTKDMKGEIKQLAGKTFRYNDEILTIKEIFYQYYTWRGRVGHHWDIFQYKTPNDPIEYDFIMTTDPKIPIKYDDLPQKLSESISTNIKKLTAKDLPDCLFELRRVKRVSTDY